MKRGVSDQGALDLKCRGSKSKTCSYYNRKHFYNYLYRICKFFMREGRNSINICEPIVRKLAPIIPEQLA